MSRPILALAVAAAGALALSACALLSTPDPVQAYRFGGTTTPAAAAPVAAARTDVHLTDVSFPEASRGDRLLGVTGVETAYIAGARWVSPARDLFTESLIRAFETQSSRVRLVGRGELTPAAYSLDLDVRTFEARYDAPGGVPTVQVAVRARLLAYPERTVAAEQIFSVAQPAGENRVSAIVQAFDLATRDLDAQLVAWTEANAAQRAP